MIYRCERVRQGTGQQFVCFVTFKLLGGWSSHSPFKFASWQLPYHQPPCIRLSSSAQSLHRHWSCENDQQASWFITKEFTLYNRAQLLSANSPSLKYISTQILFGHKILVQSVSQIFWGGNAVQIRPAEILLINACWPVVIVHVKGGEGESIVAVHWVPRVPVVKVLTKQQVSEEMGWNDDHIYIYVLMLNVGDVIYWRESCWYWMLGHLVVETESVPLTAKAKRAIPSHLKIITFCCWGFDEKDLGTPPGKTPVSRPVLHVDRKLMVGRVVLAEENV